MILERNKNSFLGNIFQIRVFGPYLEEFAREKWTERAQAAQKTGLQQRKDNININKKINI